MFPSRQSAGRTPAFLHSSRAGPLRPSRPNAAARQPGAGWERRRGRSGHTGVGWASAFGQGGARKHQGPPHAVSVLLHDEPVRETAERERELEEERFGGNVSGSFDLNREQSREAPTTATRCRCRATPLSLSSALRGGGGAAVVSSSFPLFSKSTDASTFCCGCPLALIPLLQTNHQEERKNT